MKALVIPEREPVFELDLLTGSDGSRLEQLQATVGGMIEAVPIQYPGVTGYIHGEGKFECELNRRATVLLSHTVPTLFVGDYVAGPLVGCGFNPARGDDPETGGHTDLPDAMAALVWSLPGADRELLS